MKSLIFRSKEADTKVNRAIIGHNMGKYRANTREMEQMQGDVGVNAHT